MAETPRKVLVLGSGAIKISEAAEFDYSGSQALKALREEGVESVLVNPNVATIQTSYRMADKLYLGPLEPWYVSRVIEKERPDAVMLGFGGQTALSLGVELWDKGVLGRYGIRVLGTQVDGIRRALSRGLFRETMMRRGLPIPPSSAVDSVEEAVEAAEEIGFPVILRVSFNLGGGGSFVAWSREELVSLAGRAFAQSGIGEVLVERYLHYWKEIEFEVVRDSHGDRVAVACLENMDPMGVHTGDSVVVAPCQTLSDREYQALRSASLMVGEAIGLIGEGNVQLALNPSGGPEYYVIETNPRMSRSSSLASKATGYPLAYIAAKLALGYRLYELVNTVTGRTCACFEPSLDYVVVKMPRWDLDKFEGVEESVGSEMKSIGEAMALGRSLEEALQKAVRMIDIGEPGVVGGSVYNSPMTRLEALEALRERRPYWPLYAAKAFKEGATIREVYEATGVDPYFLEAIRGLVELYEELSSPRCRREGCMDLAREALRKGFTRESIARILGNAPGEPAKAVMIDTLAAEWPASSGYFYTTYNSYTSEASPLAGRRVLVLGAGVFRIGVSVEFDWGVVSFAEEAGRLGYESVLVNYNPETVSTDWDMSSRLYFEEITGERVMDIYKIEEPEGVVAFLGGQLSNNIVGELEEKGARILGTPGASVDRAEDRAKFSRLLDELGLKQPPWTTATSMGDAMRFAEEHGYPLLVRPSYVLSGSAMSVAWSEDQLRAMLGRAYKVSPRHPVVVSKYIRDSVEAEIDAVGDGGEAVGSIIEHVEPGGVHSGDSTMTIPWRRLGGREILEMARAASLLNEALGIRGPFNLQFLAINGNVYIVELNLRASRSMPYTSKVTGYSLARAAAEAALKGRIETLPQYAEQVIDGFHLVKPRGYWGVKSPQFSWPRLKGAYPGLGAEMRSTGEAAALGYTFEEALLKSWLSVKGNRIPSWDEAVIAYDPLGEGRESLAEASSLLESMGYRVYTIEGMEIPGFDVISYRDAVTMTKKGKAGIVLTTGYTPWMDMKLRRAAVDYNTSLVLHHSLALELARALASTGSVGGLHTLELREYYKHAGIGVDGLI